MRIKRLIEHPETRQAVADDVTGRGNRLVGIALDGRVREPADAA